MKFSVAPLLFAFFFFLSKTGSAIAETSGEGVRKGGGEIGVLTDEKRELQGCSDDSTFQYVHTNKKEKSTVYEEGCKHVAAKPKKRCQKKIGGESVRDRCPYTCGECDASDSDDEFVLEGNRMYVGCDSYVFLMKIKCDLFGNEDPNLCLVKSTIVGLASNEGTAYVGETPFTPFQTYGKEIDDLDPDVVCIGSGVFSRGRIQGGMMHPTPMIFSDGCAELKQPDYMFVLKGELATDGSNDIKVDFSSDFGFTYYTKNFDAAGIYEAHFLDDANPFYYDRLRRGRKLTAGKIPACKSDPTPTICEFCKSDSCICDSCTDQSGQHNNGAPCSKNSHCKSGYCGRRSGRVTDNCAGECTRIAQQNESCDLWAARNFIDEFGADNFCSTGRCICSVCADENGLHSSDRRCSKHEECQSGHCSGYFTYGCSGRCN